MVYCGKPSKACQSCRTRRIKCDQLRPGCTQCSKISIPCTGYRDQLDLRFRDETALVARKVQSHQQTISQDSRKKSGNGHDPSIEISGIYLKISNPLQQPLQDVAINHFLGSYVQGSHFEYLPQIYTNASLATPLAASSCASAIASLSRELREPEIMKVARQFYGRALKMINAALQSPQDAPLDGTLVSVLLLGLFETVNQDKKPSPESWTTHTEGAVALLKMRGPEQFETELGKKLFVQVSNNIRVSCFQRSLRLPTQFVELDKIAAMHLDMENPILRFWPIIDNFIELQADLLDGTILETPAVIETAMNIDDQAWKLSTSMPQSWRYEELSRDAAPAGAYEQTAHLYPDHVVARLWSTIRMTRIYLHEIIHEHAGFIMAASLPLDAIPGCWAELQTIASQIAQNMAVDILASVPQFAEESKNVKSNSPPMSSASALIWPLSVAARSPLCTQPVRAYAIDRLYFFGRKARQPQAVRIAEMLESGSVPLHALHMFHLS